MMQTQTVPLVSIVTATFNSMRFIEETKQSVLDRKFKDLEWVIVDDKSTDGTREYLRKLKDTRVRLFLKEANSGIGDSYQRGCTLARGKYVMILDHDDTIPPNSLRARVDGLEHHPECEVAFGPVAYMNEESHIYKYSRFSFLNETQIVKPFNVLLGVFLPPSYPIKQGCVIIRRDVLTNNPYTFDIELFLLATSCGPSWFVAELCLNYRTFREQTSSLRHIRLITFLKLYWARYAVRFLPWYLGLFVAVYRTLIELLKVIWCFFSPRRA